MKEEVFLILEDTSLERYSSEKIFGNIYLNSAYRYFPEKDWNDFVVIILGWWIDSLAKLHSNQSSEEIFNFMDGSYAFLIKKIDTKLCHLIFYDTGNDVVIEEIINSSFKKISESIFMSACRLEEYCLNRNWIDDDIRELLRSIKKYKSILLSSHIS